MLAPIVSVKHFIAQTNALLTGGSLRNQVLVNAVAVGDAHSNTFDVTEGSVIKAVHLDFWVMNDGATDTNTQWTAILEKVVAGQAAATITNLLNLQAYDNKKNILHTFQGNLSAAVDGANSTTYLQGWFKIPKGKQRFGIGDSLVISATSVAQNCVICGIAIYKEYQ